MRCLLEIDFETPQDARNAAKVVGAGADRRSGVQSRVDKNVLILDITATGFSALRARATSAMRDVRVYLDARAVVGE